MKCPYDFKAGDPVILTKAGSDKHGYSAGSLYTVVMISNLGPGPYDWFITTEPRTGGLYCHLIEHARGPW